MAEKKSQAGKSEQTPLWEWVLAAVGVLLVAGAVLTMVYRGLTQDGVPAHFSVTAGSASSINDSYVVPFSVKNLGSQTAADLTIEATLIRGEQTVETSNVTLDYVPANSEREGVMFFTKNPNDFELEFRALGYNKP